MPRFIIAPDSFKGTLSAAEVCDIIGEAFACVFPGADILKLPVADGGEGLSSSLHGILGGRRVEAIVSGVFGEPVKAGYTVLPDGTAAMDMAACAGLPLAGDRKNPALASTFGVGELIKDARGRGAERILLGLGGSATNDCGIGMAAALGFRFLDEGGNAVEPVGRSMAAVVRIVEPENKPDVTVTAACDVDNPLFGVQGAAYVFSPQKGADPAMVKELDAGLRNMARVIREDLKKDVSAMPGAGAAGGMGAGVVAFLGGSLRSGIDLVLDAAGFDALLENADAVITGEGKMDAQSVRGKVPAGVAKRAASKGKPVIAVCGCLGEGADAMRELGVMAMFASGSAEDDFEAIQKTCRPALYTAARKAAEYVKNNRNIC